jgi:uncharacterized protein (DUF4415 family)
MMENIVIEVAGEHHQHDLAEGLHENEIMSVGTHVFKRGGFRERHTTFKPKESKLRINICLDADVVRHFRNRAATSNSAPYQTQINNELWAIMERDLQTSSSHVTGQELLDDEEFLRALADRLKDISSQKT